MRRMMMALTALYRRWRYVEEEGGGAPRTAASSGSEVQRLRRAIERDQRLVEDYRRNGCPGLAREREASLRMMRSRLALLES
jgi:hypothetical protein